MDNEDELKLFSHAKCMTKATLVDFMFSVLVLVFGPYYLIIVNLFVSAVGYYAVKRLDRK